MGTVYHRTRFHTHAHEDHTYIEDIHARAWIQRKRICPPYTYVDNATDGKRRKRGRIEIVEEKEKTKRVHASKIQK